MDRFTKDQLKTVSHRLFALCDEARKTEQAEDADVLQIAANVCALCADSFGMPDSRIKSAENQACAARVRHDLLAMMAPVSEPVADPECCPYSNAFHVEFNICPECRVRS